VRHTKRRWNKKGQNLIEYALIVAVIATAMIAMSTYVFRSVQATQQMIQKGFREN
jgi:Flp pilus assembly pilin Flp